MTVMDKISLRKKLLTERNDLRGEERRQREQAINTHLIAWLDSLPQYGVMGYLATRGEADIAPLLDEVERRGRAIYLPRVMDKAGGIMQAVNMPVPWREHVERGAYGIWEPSGDIQGKGIGSAVILVPGVGFDTALTRIGFGGGYYDRFLPRLPADTVKVGICFALQIIERLPRDEHDVGLDALCTETGFIRRLP
jgi:5-formyltetrahydrofolate cyclo-ligase